MLSAMQQEGRIVIVDTLNLESHKTKLMVSALNALGLGGKRVMVLTGDPSDQLWRATRNLPDVRIKSAVDVSN